MDAAAGGDRPGTEAAAITITTTAATGTPETNITMAKVSSTPSISSTAQLQRFFQMPEIVAHILDNLSLPDLHACIGVSCLFRAAALSRYYRRISLPIEDDTPGRGNIERFTTTVELHHRSHAECASTHPFKLRRLRTLIFHKDEVDEHPGQGPARDNYGIPLDFGHYSCSELTCLSRGFEPERIAVRPWMTAGKEKRVFFVPPTECDSVVIHMRRPGPYGYRRDLTRRATQQARHITVVILPSFFGQFKSFTTDGSRVSATGSKNVDNDTLIRECIAPYLLDYPQNELTIVGLEDANPFASELHWSERHMREADEDGALRGYLDRLMDGTAGGTVGMRDLAPHHLDAEARQQRQARIHVRTTRDYFESGEWGEEIWYQIVGSWLNAYHKREHEDRVKLEKAAAVTGAGACAGGGPSASSATCNASSSSSSPYTTTPTAVPRLIPHRRTPSTLSIMAEIAAKTAPLRHLAYKAYSSMPPSASRSSSRSSASSCQA